ncbi:hypothetical protein DMB90_10160 [Raoultella planticola]|uniref:Uncharacterized protein n=1 Tax=Raoultella planticola TaxID=575 RepID=A0A5P6A9Q3_RAOPL|nr:hypothetical protein DMB90_10160 [Raoultella planticola]
MPASWWGLAMDIIRAHGVPWRALLGPLCGAVMLVAGAGWWPDASFSAQYQRMAPPLFNCSRRVSCSSCC